MHGNIFEDFRNDKLNADNWGRNWQGLTRSPMRWNQFGGTIGGPVKKDKLFFFADYQGLRQATPPALSSVTVMPTAWRTGDFSSLLQHRLSPAPKLPSSFTIPSRRWTRRVTAHPFTGNIIPQSLLSPAASKLMDRSLYPSPQNGTDHQQLHVHHRQLHRSDQGDIKLDCRPNDKDYFSSRYSHGRQDNPGVNNLPAVL